MGKKLTWSPSDPSLARESYNAIIRKEWLDVPEQMMKHASMGTKALMGPDWIPSGMVTRKIAALLTKEEAADEARHNASTNSYPDDAIPVMPKRFAPPAQGSRLNRPVSAPLYRGSRPQEGRMVPISLESPWEAAARQQAQQSSQSALQASASGALEPSLEETPSAPAPALRQRPQSAVQRGSAPLNPYHLENRAEHMAKSRYPARPIRIDGMGCAMEHIRQGNNRVIWTELRGFGRQGHARPTKPDRPASATMQRSTSSPAHQDTMTQSYSAHNMAWN